MNYYVFCAQYIKIFITDIGRSLSPSAGLPRQGYTVIGRLMHTTCFMEMKTLSKLRHSNIVFMFLKSDGGGPDVGQNRFFK